MQFCLLFRLDPLQIIPFHIFAMHMTMGCSLDLNSMADNSRDQQYMDAEVIKCLSLHERRFYRRNG